MIEFRHRLPAMNIPEQGHNGTYNNEELAIPGILTTKDPVLGKFMHTLRKNIYCSRSLIFLGGKCMMVNKNWIRDYVYIMKGMKYFEDKMLPFLDFIIENQREDGQFYELVKQMDDYHWKMVNEDCRKLYEEDNLSLVRLELEADIEFLVVEGAKCQYQISGDDAWLGKVLPNLERGIDYMTSDEKRWDREHGLVKRAYTIDMWDFINNPASPGDRRIHENEPMCAMHGDNSGVYCAMLDLAWLNRRLGREEKALNWEKRAEALRENIFRYLWNGSFFVHQFPLNCAPEDDKENIRLSISNPYDINRGLTDLAQSRAIIEEYMRRRNTTEKFAEWFTVDPPYEKFLTYKNGEYVNGAISPFTAGELAKAAFNHGYEDYGWDIISRFVKLAERDGDVYFLYYPDSKPQDQRGPSTWGAAALLSAIDEGLAGIVNTDVNYRKIRFSPRFPVTDYEELRYFTGYEKNDTVVDVKYILMEAGMRYDITSPAVEIDAHFYLPEGKSCAKLLVNGKETPFTAVSVADSRYVDVKVQAEKTVSFEILFA